MCDFVIMFDIMVELYRTGGGISIDNCRLNDFMFFNYEFIYRLLNIIFCGCKVDFDDIRIEINYIIGYMMVKLYYVPCGCDFYMY